MGRNQVWGSVPDRLAAAGGDVDAAATSLLDELSGDEVVAMLAGDRTPLDDLRAAVTGRYNFVPYPAASIERLDFPGIRFADGPRGVVVGHSTAFPVPMARGATFDPSLERRVGDAIGREVTAQGANLFAGICVNLLRHPAWGRAQETYGEDPLLLGEMGSALACSVGEHAATCVKHFALNSIENSRFVVDVQVDESDLRDIYLPHFERIVRDGVDSVMSAYNKVNGQWCGQHHHLLDEILKGEWGFDGFVMTDFALGVHDMVDAVDAGQDLEMPARMRARKLPAALADGRLSAERVRGAAHRTARSVFEACRRSAGHVSEGAVVLCDDHLDLARDVARRSFVLLRNESVDDLPVLPVRGPDNGGDVRRLALVGRLAALANTGDRGSSSVRSPKVVTPAEGLGERADRHGISITASLDDDPDEATRVAARADAAIVVVGNTWRDEGEFVGVHGGDRSTLELRASHRDLVESVAAVCQRTIVVLVGGSAFACEAWLRQVPAVLMGWYAGAEGGRALAEVLLGEAAPGGRLPSTWARSARQLPPFRRWTRRITYGPLHGYRLATDAGNEPSFWFGHGLGYRLVEWGEPRLDGGATGADGPVTVTVPLLASGTRTPGDGETVQAYLDLALGSHPRQLPTLAGFERVELSSTDSAEARVVLDAALVERARRAGGATVRVGRSADPTRLIEVGHIT